MTLEPEPGVLAHLQSQLLRGRGKCNSVPGQSSLEPGQAGLQRDPFSKITNTWKIQVTSTLLLISELLLNHTDSIGMQMSHISSLLNTFVYRPGMVACAFNPYTLEAGGSLNLRLVRRFQKKNYEFVFADVL